MFENEPFRKHGCATLTYPKPQKMLPNGQKKARIYDKEENKRRKIRNAMAMELDKRNGSRKKGNGREKDQNKF